MKITIHKEGYPVIILILFILLTIILVLNIIFPYQTFYHYSLYLSAAVFYFFVIRFFRDPIREVIPDKDKVISGADGKIVVIEEVEEKEYFKGKRMQVSVFMSPTDVHVNWLPVSGKIKYYKHNPGFYFIASKPKSSEENERTTIVVELEDHKEIMFRQIAGTVARRIVCYAKEGKYVQQGDELGIIKFGSRFDIFLPLDTKIDVKLGQKVTGCETVIARF
ncbi:MAG: phosphatidylserine decarboxylase family protein [Bacteroidetes bacterium]|nr:MAG: phosphatidylserine decarboxylase family protein [Bacteroidota bacterium]